MQLTTKTIRKVQAINLLNHLKIISVGDSTENVYVSDLLKKGKLILQIRPTEYKWVNNMVSALKISSNKYIVNNDIWNYKGIKQEFPEIKNDNHDKYTMSWTINIARNVIDNGWSIEACENGLSFSLPYFE